MRPPATAPPAAERDPLTPVSEDGGEAAARRRALPWRVLPWALLGLMVIAGFYLRLRHNGYGLPYVYNYDEANHFTDKAVSMLAGGPNGLDPGYYQNPSGL